MPDFSEACIGEIRIWPINFAPHGWFFCQGQLLPIQDYQALYALLGTTYGGNGINNFALPDLRGRAALGVGHGPGLSPAPQGERLGAEAISLSSASAAQGESLSVVAPGSGELDNREPYIALNFIIAWQGIFPFYP